MSCRSRTCIGAMTCGLLPERRKECLKTGESVTTYYKSHIKIGKSSHLFEKSLALKIFQLFCERKELKVREKLILGQDLENIGNFRHFNLWILL